MSGRPIPAAAARHPHLAETEPDGWIRVDLHMHTMWSGDATTTPEELCTAVEESQIDVLCITDHSTINGAVELAEASAMGCRVVVGEEVRTTAGEIIGLFLTERLPFGMPPEEAASRIRAQGGLVYVPHPFDEMRHCLAEPALFGLAEAGLIDAVEIFNAKTSLPSLNGKAAEFAARFGLPGGGASDAHEPSALGAAFVAMPDFDPDDPASFLAALGSGVVRGHHYDAPRQWRPRIVPSTRAH